MVTILYLKGLNNLRRVLLIEFVSYNISYLDKFSVIIASFIIMQPKITSLIICISSSFCYPSLELCEKIKCDLLEVVEIFIERKIFTEFREC